MRVVMEYLRYCYGTLGIVHTYFCYLPNNFDDYVAN